MPRPKRTLVAATVVAFVLALAWWLNHRFAEPSPDTGPASAESAAGRGKASTLAGMDGGSALTAWPWQRPTATISGTITTRGAGPIAGAEVCVWSSHPDAPSSLFREPLCTTTSGDGRFVLEDVPAIHASIHASAAEHIPGVYEETPADTTIELKPGEARAGVDIALRPGGVRIAGVVRDLAGGVIEGALVTCEGGDWSWRSVRARAVTRSDGEGRFAMWAEPGSASVSAWAEGYGHASRYGATPGTTFELFLTPESVIVGRVVRADTKAPVEGAFVSAYGGSDSTLTDADGRFRIEQLEPGRYHPSATTDDGRGSSVEAVHVGLAETSQEVLIELHRVASVAGTIVIAGTKNEPCEEGGLSLTARGGKSEAVWGESRSDGTVLLRAVEPGEYDVRASCKGHVTRTDFDPVVVAADPIEGLVWALESGASVRGVVVDDEGRPVGEATVYASLIVEGRGGSVQSSYDRTATDGTFALEGLVPGPYRVNVKARGLVSPNEEIRIEVTDGGLTDVRLELHAGGSVKGRVVDASGSPVATATVRLEGADWEQQAPTADDGSFLIEAVEAGDYRAVAQTSGHEQMRAPGQSDDDVGGEPVHVVAGETASVELVVEALDGTIAGRVVDGTGAPVSDAFIDGHRESDSTAAAEGGNRQRVRWGSWGRQPVLTDEDGAFTLDGLSDGNYTILAHRKGGGEAVAEHIAVGSTSVELSIADTGSIAGTVTIAGGGPPDKFLITASDRAAGVWERDRFYRTSGKFRLSELPAGTYEVAVTSDHGDAAATVELGAGQDVDDLALELEPRVTLRGRVVDLDTGDPVPGMRVSAGTKQGGGGFSFSNKGDEPHITDDDGRFELANAPAGSIRIHVIPRTFNGDQDYGWSRTVAEVPTDVAVFDLPDLTIVKNRRRNEDPESDLGLKLEEAPPGVDFEEHAIVVAFVRPGGPAEKGGVKVGDVVESVDGHDVTGANRHRYGALTGVKVGTSVRLGMSDGRSVTVVAGPLP